MDMDNTLVLKMAQTETDSLPKSEDGVGYQSAKFQPAGWTQGGRVD